MPVSEEVVFHNGTVFDGRAFLPAGTCVWVAGGRITGVGPGPAGRIHFFAQAALLGNVLFLVIVVLNVAGTVYQLPCRQS